MVRIVGTHFDLTERRRAEAERTHTELLARLVFAQEDERRRIAREMHDQFGEQLTALAHRIAALRDGCRDTPDLAEKVQALERVAERIDRDVDHLVWELRPTALDDLGLAGRAGQLPAGLVGARRHCRGAAHVRPRTSGSRRRSKRRCIASRRKP